MVRFGALILATLLAGIVMVAGCNGGDGGGGEPAFIVGTWAGPMTHHIIDNNKGTDTTVTYGVTFYILDQDGNHVSGKMRLRDDTHVGLLSGNMSGNTFKGVRTGTHTVQIEFTVSGDSLTGTFRFVGDGLDEYGEYTCTKQ